MPTYQIKVDGNKITDFETETRLSDIQRRNIAQAYAKGEGISERGVTVVELRKHKTHLENRKDKRDAR